MSLQSIHTGLADQWVKITGISQPIKKVLPEFETENVIGYVYIDHEAGVTLDIIKLFEIQGEEIVFQESPADKNIRVICRLNGILQSDQIDILSEELIEKYQLEKPEYLHIYERKDLEVFRQIEDFHPFRAEGYPDDLQILLPPTETLQPELIWGRVEKFENGKLTCQILNQPRQNFGVKLNDLVQASPYVINDEKYLVCELESQSQPEPKKPWWKFW